MSCSRQSKLNVETERCRRKLEGRKWPVAERYLYFTRGVQRAGIQVVGEEVDRG